MGLYVLVFVGLSTTIFDWYSDGADFVCVGSFVPMSCARAAVCVRVSFRISVSAAVGDAWMSTEQRNRV